MTLIVRLLRRLQAVYFWSLDLRRFRWVLLADFVVFTFTGVCDFFLTGGELVFSSLIRIAIGMINLVGWFEVRKYLKTMVTSLAPWGFPSVIAGQASSIPMLIIPFWIEISGYLHDFLDFVVLIIPAFLLFFAVAIPLSAIIDHKGSLTLTWGLVAALVPFAGLLQFWYVTFYKPDHERPRVNVIVELDKVRQHPGDTQMRGTITLENVGTAEVAVLEAVYAVTGHTVEPAGHTLVPADVRHALDKHRATWDDESEYKGLLKVGRFIRRGGHLTPAQKVKTSFVFDVKSYPREKLRLTASLSLINSNAHFDKFKPCDPIPNETYECFQTKLPPQSLIRYLLGDGPMAQISFFQPTETVRVPHLVTNFLALNWKGDPGKDPNSQVNALDPFHTSRGVTSSVEFRVDR
ncbi:hypothetical protein ABZT17_02750 [Streptomyces sp. NPDC005648]|uniref:hypothetical protein n=1 Tax=Streptomyces sp. NPDC005648 TaxID=3157044 RepID=UPI0033A258A6